MAPNESNSWDAHYVLLSHYCPLYLFIYIDIHNIYIFIIIDVINLDYNNTFR